MNSQPDPRQLADRHAKEAERLLARRFGFIDNRLFSRRVDRAH